MASLKSFLYLSREDAEKIERRKKNPRFYPTEASLHFSGEDELGALPNWNSVYKNESFKKGVTSNVWIDDMKRKYGLLSKADQALSGVNNSAYWIALPPLPLDESEIIGELPHFPDIGETVKLVSTTNPFLTADFTVAQYLKSAKSVATLIGWIKIQDNFQSEFFLG